MQSQAKDVDAYLAEVPAERRAALTRLRELCRRTLIGYTEGMHYGMPGYTAPGAEEGEVGFASQKQYIALYILKQPALEAHRAELAGLSVGKGCIRYRRPEQIDFKVVKKLLTTSRKLKAPVC